MTIVSSSSPVLERVHDLPDRAVEAAQRPEPALVAQREHVELLGGERGLPQTNVGLSETSGSFTDGESGSPAPVEAAQVLRRRHRLAAAAAAALVADVLDVRARTR